MTLYKVSYWDGNTWQEIGTWDRPFTLGYKLDETLDVGVLTIQVAEYIRLKPFTPVLLEVIDDSVTVEREVVYTFQKQDAQAAMT